MIVIESLFMMVLLLCSHVMLGMGDPVTEQLKVTSMPVAGKMILDGDARIVGEAGSTKIQ